MRDGEGERWVDVGSRLNFALVAASLAEAEGRGAGGQMESPVFSCQDRSSFFCLTGPDGTVVSWSLADLFFLFFLGGTPVFTHPRVLFPCAALSLWGLRWPRSPRETASMLTVRV